MIDAIFKVKYKIQDNSPYYMTVRGGVVSWESDSGMNMSLSNDFQTVPLLVWMLRHADSAEHARNIILVHLRYSKDAEVTTLCSV